MPELPEVEAHSEIDCLCNCFFASGCTVASTGEWVALDTMLASLPLKKQPRRTKATHRQLDVAQTTGEALLGVVLQRP